LLPSCAKQRPAADAPSAARQPAATASRTAVQQEPIAPIEAAPPLDPRKVELGRKLFHDPALSRDGSVSCATCHPLDRGGTDRRIHSVGVGGQEGTVNAPTVFNSAANFRQFWDGRADTLENQIDGPLQAANEMASKWEDVLSRLAQSPAYVAAFKVLYPGGVRRESVKDAIATFERTLVTPGARFDRYLRGEADSLTDSERAGYAKFKNYGCISCHQGVNVGANMYQRMGVIRDYFADRGHVTAPDYGRFNLTHDEADRYVFKVPSLRNIALTPPYFHDGSAQTLEEAVTVMARYQLGRPLPPADLADIVKFLQTLTGEYEGRPL
jgi:cytochrome c peroxidase